MSEIKLSIYLSYIYIVFLFFINCIYVHMNAMLNVVEKSI